MKTLPFRFPEPKNCVLWNNPELVSGPLRDRFEVLETFTNESHLMRHLLKCRECGHLYFHEFYEWIAESGNDPQYVTYVPVSTQQDAQILSHADVFKVSECEPAIRKDFPEDAEVPKIYWRGK